MRFAILCLVYFLQTCNALLEDPIISFKNTIGAVPIHHASIIHSSEDAVGVKIAVDSLVNDWEAITGRRPNTIQHHFNGTQAAPTVGGNGTSAVIVATYGSRLASKLYDTGCLGRNSTLLEGKREAFVTMLGERCLPGVDRALIIIGSDMRGTIFGIYTLAEQSGQSP